jgi:hypothetical protein
LPEHRADFLNETIYDGINPIQKDPNNGYRFPF